MAVRLIALLMSITLTGPATASLLCDWACAVKHERAAEASGGCHDQDTSSPSVSTTLAVGHACHELAAPSASILTPAPHAELLASATVESSATWALTRARVGVVVRPPGASNTPPLSVTPLRI